MAASRGRNTGAMENEMSERKMMEEEMSRFELEIQTGQDDEDYNDDDDEADAAAGEDIDDDDDGRGDYPPDPPTVPPGIPQALSVLGTPNPSLMNLRFPPPPMPAPAAPGTSIPASTSTEPPGVHNNPRGLPASFSAPVLPTPAPAPAPPGTVPTTTPLELPGSFQPTNTEGQRLPGPGQSASQPLPPGVQQMSSEATPPAPRPAFVPHQVRARPPVMPHRPPMYQMQHHRMPHHPPVPGPMNAMPAGPMNYRMGPRPPGGPPGGPPMGPMMPRGFPMMHPRPMGMMQQLSPAVIQAKPTTYSAKPVKFSKTKKAQKLEESSEAAKLEAATTANSEYNMQSPAFTHTAAFTQPAVPSQAPMQMYGAAAQPAAVDYSSMVHQQQQQQQHAEAMAAGSSTSSEQKRKEKKKKFIRTAANTTWEDDSLAEWDANDFRIFCGDLGNEVTDDLLTKVFGRYPSFVKAKVVRDKRTSKTKGYGFVSFKDPNDFVQAMREWNGKYVGNRPIKLRKSTWKDRNIDTFKKKQKEKQKLGLR